MSPTEKLTIVTLRMTPDLKAAIDAAADDAHLGFTDWCRAVLARAANEGAFAPPKKGKKHGKKGRAGSG